MITILCAGSRGDYQPYIALAQQLMKLGKQVRITAGKDFEPFIRQYGIEVFPLSADLTTVDIDPKLLQQAGSADNPLKMLLAFNKMKKFGTLMGHDYYNACVGSELIIYHPGCTMGYFAGEHLGIPAVLASPFPMHKTKEYLSVVLYGKVPSNQLTTALSYKMLQNMLWLASSGSVKPFWKEQFGKLPPSFGPPYEKHKQIKKPALISCSDEIFKRPADWSEHIHQLGYWFVEEADTYQPPEALQNFLADGDAPVYIGFGSMAMTDDLAELAEISAKALLIAGKRGIIAGMGKPKTLSEEHFVLDQAPHTWLFERVSVVCHHGGAGTSASGFRAGVPSVIIPFSNDQFAWAHRAYHLGIGAKPIPKKELTAQRLAEGILESLSSETVEKAKSVGERIRRENGAKACAEVLYSTYF